MIGQFFGTRSFGSVSGAAAALEIGAALCYIFQGATRILPARKVVRC